MDNPEIILSMVDTNRYWFKNSKTMSVYILLLLLAEREDRYRGFDKIRKGSVDITNEIIADFCGLTIQNVRTALSTLEKHGDIKRERRNHYQIITITDFEPRITH